MADNVFYNDYYRKHTDCVAIVIGCGSGGAKRCGVGGGKGDACRSLSLSVSMDVTSPKQ